MIKIADSQNDSEFQRIYSQNNNGEAVFWSIFAFLLTSIFSAIIPYNVKLIGTTDIITKIFFNFALISLTLLIVYLMYNSIQAIRRSVSIFYSQSENKLKFSQFIDRKERNSIVLGKDDQIYKYTKEINDSISIEIYIKKSDSYEILDIGESSKVLEIIEKYLGQEIKDIDPNELNK